MKFKHTMTGNFLAHKLNAKLDAPQAETPKQEQAPQVRRIQGPKLGIHIAVPSRYIGC